MGPNGLNAFNLSSLVNREQERKLGMTEDEARRRDFERRVQAKEELEKLNRRRAEREQEQLLREQEESRMARLNESAAMAEWDAKEEQFHLEQARKRAEIRVRENRAKPIDLLALNLKWSVPRGEKKEGEEEEEDDGAGLDVDLEEPYKIFDVSTRTGSRVLIKLF